MQVLRLENSYQMCTRTGYYENLIRVAAAPKKQVLSDVVLEKMCIRDRSSIPLPVSIRS